MSVKFPQPRYVTILRIIQSLQSKGPINFNSLLEESTSEETNISSALSKSYLRVSLLKETASFAASLGLWVKQDAMKAQTMIWFPELGPSFSRGVAEISTQWQGSTKNFVIMTRHLNEKNQPCPETFYDDLRYDIFDFLSDCGFMATRVTQGKTHKYVIPNGSSSNVTAILLQADTIG